jgi:hypothetical protein
VRVTWLLVGFWLAALLALPSAAVAAGSTNPLSPNNPLSPGIPQSPASTPTTTTPPILNPTTTSSSDSGLSGSSAAAIAIGAIVILGGISMFIWRDARRRAPVRDRAAGLAAAGADGRSGSKQRAKQRKLSPAERRRRKRGRAR